jgi:hypothetical protein
MNLVFEDEGAERSWRLDAVSSREFLALLLRGEMGKGRRVVLKGAEAAIEPGARHDGQPVLCVMLDHVEVCVQMDRQALDALGREIERALRR